MRNGPIQVTGAVVLVAVAVITGTAILSHDTNTTTTEVAVAGEVTATTIEEALVATPVAEVRTTAPTTTPAVEDVGITLEAQAPRNVAVGNSVDVGSTSIVVSHYRGIRLSVGKVPYNRRWT